MEKYLNQRATELREKLAQAKAKRIQADHEIAAVAAALNEVLAALSASMVPADSYDEQK